MELAGFGHFDLGFGEAEAGLGFVELLFGDGFGRFQLLHAAERDSGEFRLGGGGGDGGIGFGEGGARFVAAGFGLFDGRVGIAGVDDGDDLAGLDRVAFADADFADVPGEAGADGAGGAGGDGAGENAFAGEAPGFDGGGGDADGGRLLFLFAGGFGFGAAGGDQQQGGEEFNEGHWNLH